MGTAGFAKGYSVIRPMRSSVGSGTPGFGKRLGRPSDLARAADATDIERFSRTMVWIANALRNRTIDEGEAQAMIEFATGLLVARQTERVLRRALDRLNAGMSSGQRAEERA
jgi:hypothetical protein